MTTGALEGKRIAILVTGGFEHSELLESATLDHAGAITRVVSPAGENAKGWNHKDLGGEVPGDVPLASANAVEFDLWSCREA